VAGLPVGSSDEATLDEVANNPSAFVLILSGHHDHPESNGRYTYDGIENGKPKFAKRGGNPKVFWTGHSWDCFWGGYSPEAPTDTPVPPFDGYNRDQGGCDIKVRYKRISERIKPQAIAETPPSGLWKGLWKRTIELVHDPVKVAKTGPEGRWEVYRNIDMAFQGDVEIIGDWKRHTSIDKLKKIVEEKGYSAVCVGSFGHAALKSFEYQLTKEHCQPSEGYTNELHIWFPSGKAAKPPKVAKVEKELPAGFHFHDGFGEETRGDKIGDITSGRVEQSCSQYDCVY
jgi:hypothetical protein